MKRSTHPKKKFSYFINVPMQPGELTVVKNTHAEDAMRHSVRLAKEAHDAGLGVLLINCGMTDRRFREHFSEVCEESERGAKLIVHTATRGNLAADREEIEPIIAKNMIGIVIIVGWEWSSDSYRRSRKLYTFLWELLDWQGVAISVYANAAHEIVAGKFDQHGLGKLPLMAYATCDVESAEKFETLDPKPKPLIASDHEHRQAEKGVAELVRKLNDLPGSDAGGDGEYAEAA